MANGRSIFRHEDLGHPNSSLLVQESNDNLKLIEREGIFLRVFVLVYQAILAKRLRAGIFFTTYKEVERRTGYAGEQLTRGPNVHALQDV